MCYDPYKKGCNKYYSDKDGTKEIKKAKKEKSRAYHRQYSREYRARNLEKQREYDRMKTREYRARRRHRQPPHSPHSKTE